MSDVEPSTADDLVCVGTALAVLLIADYRTVNEALAALEECARQLGVPVADVAAYVRWRGELPV